ESAKSFRISFVRATYAICAKSQVCIPHHRGSENPLQITPKNRTRRNTRCNSGRHRVDCKKLFSARLARPHPVRIIAAHARRPEVACQRTPALAQAKDGGTTASERDPDEEGQAEARPENRSRECSSSPPISARVHPDREGLRDAACGAEVRSR